MAFVAKSRNEEMFLAKSLSAVSLVARVERDVREVGAKSKAVLDNILQET
jgi:hypothetical protein